MWLAAIVGLSICGAVDVALNGRVTWLTPVWASLFVIGFHLNYGGGKK